MLYETLHSHQLNVLWCWLLDSKGLGFIPFLHKLGTTFPLPDGACLRLRGPWDCRLEASGLGRPPPAVAHLGASNYAFFIE